MTFRVTRIEVVYFLRSIRRESLIFGFAFVFFFTLPLCVFAQQPPKLGKCPEAGSSAGENKAVTNFFTCLDKEKTKGTPHAKAVVVDADLGVAYIIDTTKKDDPSGAISKCYGIGVGKNSKGATGGADLGGNYVGKSKLTPPGLMRTFSKKDARGPFEKYEDFVGLQGMNGDNNATRDRGVLLHLCLKNYEYTEGCVCFKKEEWPEIQSLISSQNKEDGTFVYTYAKSMKGDGCANDKGDSADPNASRGTRK